MSRTAYFLWTAVLLSAGFLIRLSRFPRVIYLDEAWMINAVVDLSWRDMLFHPQWLPVPSPGLLVTLRTILGIIGPTEARVEVLFLAVSIAGMVAAALLGRQLFDRPGSLIFTAILALSPLSVDISVQVKWYGCDLLIACLALLFLVRYMEAPSRERYLALTGLLIVGLAFSYTSVFFVLPACWAVWRAGSAEGRWARVAGCAIATGSAGFLIWYTFVHPHRDPALQQYWSVYFPPLSPAIATYYARRFADLALFIFYPVNFSSRLVPGAIGLVILCGSAFLAANIRTRERQAIAALGPIAGLFALNFGRMYPLGGERTNLFALPSLTILFVAGLEGIAHLVRQRIRPMPVSPVLSAALAFWVVLTVVSLRGESLDQVADVPRTLDFLRQDTRPGDAILIHPTLDEQFRFYRRLQPPAPGTFVTGAIGWPCCTRYGRFLIGPVETDALFADFRKALDASKSKKVWYVYYEHLAGARVTQRDERGQLLAAARDHGCHVAPPRYFGGISIDEIACPAN